MMDLDALTARLKAVQAELLQLADEDDSAAVVELDQSRVGRLSRMDALQMQSMSLEAKRRRGIELHRIAAALKRVEEGEYGYCLSCGEPISPQRLEVDIAATLCIDCAEKAERQ